MIIRQYSRKDIPQLIRLWSKTFGDPEDFVSAFLDLLPAAGSCFIAEEDEKVISSAYILCGASSELNGQSIPTAYLYSVATEKAYRGKGAGRAVCIACTEYARQNGCLMIATLPANEALYGWYSEIIGTSEKLTVHTERVKAASDSALHPASAEEYYALRCSLLEGEEHLSVPLSWIKLLELLCRSFGGGLFASSAGICACSTDPSGSCVISELLPACSMSTAAHAAYMLHAPEAVCRLPGGDSSYIAHDQTGIPRNLIWNLSFD